MNASTQESGSGKEPEIRCVEQEHCVTCGGRGELVLEGLKDRLFRVAGLWSLSRCLSPGCGTTWLNPRPIEADLYLTYQSYYTHGGNTPPVKSGLFAKSAIRLSRIADSLIRRALGIDRARRRINELYADRASQGSLLEVGCGDGRRLSKWAEKGWDVLGQDVDPSAVELGELKALNLDAERFDMVAGNHVIEHVSDPSDLFRECYRLLKPGGVLVLTNPNPESLGSKKWGENWFFWDPPRHLNLFTPSGLQVLSERAGFETERAFTSAARAHSVAAGSLEIREVGGHVMGRQVHWWVYIRALVFLYRAWLSPRSKTVSGEETVLIARRPLVGG